MITLADIRKKAENKYLSVLKSEFSGQNPFPLTLGGTGIPLSVGFQERMKGIEALGKGVKKDGKPAYVLNLATRSTRKEGSQTWLKSVSFPEGEDFYGFLGKNEEVKVLEENVLKIRSALPELEEWIVPSLRQIIKRSAQWDELIQVLLYFRDRDTAGLYLREVPLELPTKFPEQNEAFLKELLDIILPEERINREEEDLSLRYGLKKDRDFRFRILTDPEDDSLSPFHDLAVLPEELALWRPASPRVLIVENKLSFLLFPEMPGLIKIWGHGKSLSLLRDVPWLADKDVIYWGDLDPQGFEILSLLREFLPQSRSLCMDWQTFQDHQDYAVIPSAYSLNEDLLLTEEEEKIYRHLTDRKDGRLEQERILPDYAVKVLEEKIAALETEGYLLKRASQSSKNDFLAVLKKVPDTEPDEYDK